MTTPSSLNEVKCWYCGGKGRRTTYDYPPCGCSDRATKKIVECYVCKGKGMLPQAGASFTYNAES